MILSSKRQNAYNEVMSTSNKSRRIRAGAAFAAMAIAIALMPLLNTVFGCPFCAKLGKTLTDYASESQGIFVCEWRDQSWLIRETLKNPPHATMSLSTKSLTKPATGSAIKLLVFSKIKGQALEPFRTITIRDNSLIEYLRESANDSLQIAHDKLGFYFRNLNASDPLISDDAYKSIAKLNTAEIQAASIQLDRKQLRQWISESPARAERIGLYGLLLGLCGDTQDADFLHDLASRDDQQVQFADGKAGFLGGLTVLDFDRGVALALTILNDKKRNESSRRAALGALQFAITEMPRIDPFPIFEKMEPALQFADIGPLVIDEMRKGAYARSAKEIVRLGRESKSTAIRAAAIRFALTFATEDTPAFLEGIRTSNPQSLVDAEQLLRFEKNLMLNPPRLQRKKPAAPQKSSIQAGKH